MSLIWIPIAVGCAMAPPEAATDATQAGKGGTTDASDHTIDAVPVEEVRNPDAVWFAEVIEQPAMAVSQASVFDVSAFPRALANEGWCASQPAQSRFVSPVAGCFARVGMAMAGATMVIRYGASALLPLVGSSSYATMALRIGAGAALGLGGGVGAVILIAVALASAQPDGGARRLPVPGPAFHFPRIDVRTADAVDVLPEIDDVDPSSAVGQTLDQWYAWARSLEASVNDAAAEAAPSENDWQEWHDAPNCASGFDNAWRGEKCPDPSTVLKSEAGTLVAILIMIIKAFTWDFLVYCITNPIEAFIIGVVLKHLGKIFFFTKWLLGGLFGGVGRFFSYYSRSSGWFRAGLERDSWDRKVVVSDDEERCGRQPFADDEEVEGGCAADLPILCCAAGTTYLGNPLSRCGKGFKAMTTYLTRNNYWGDFPVCQCVPIG